MIEFENIFLILNFSLFVRKTKNRYNVAESNISAIRGVEISVTAPKTNIGKIAAAAEKNGTVMQLYIENLTSVTFKNLDIPKNAFTALLK